MDDPHHAANSDALVFRPQLSRRGLALAVWLLFALGFGLASPRMAETGTGLGLLIIGIALLTVVYLPAVYHFIWLDRVVVTDDGILWRIQGFRGFVPWANIGRIARWRFAAGLQLEQPVKLNGSLYAQLRPGPYFRGGYFIPINHIVPIRPRFPLWQESDLHWRRFRATEFGRLLEARVPHIFDSPFPTVVTNSDIDANTG